VKKILKWTGFVVAAVAGLVLIGGVSMSACTECHGQDLDGNPAAKAPPLAIAKGYSPEQFSRLLHEGVPLSNRPLELMSPTARARFAVLTAEETAAMYEFLQSRQTS